MASTKALLSILFLAAGSVSAATVQPAIKAVPVDGKNGPEDLYRAWNLTGEIQAQRAYEEMHGKPEEDKGPPKDVEDTAFKALAAKVGKFKSISVVGDSYSSGDGALGGWGSGKCKRNQGSFGARINKLLNPDSFQFLACSGAPVEDILKKQVNGGEYDKPDLVLLTAGGDNGGSFVHVLLGCILQKSSKKCDAALTLAKNTAAAMPESLTPLYQAINKTESRPGRKREVVHLGYVQMYHRDKDASECPVHGAFKGTDVTWPSTGDGGYRDQINEVIAEINDQISATAQKFGFKFIDVDPFFAGHKLCDGPNASWMQHKLTLNEDGVICHPTFDGHGAYIKATLEYLASKK